MHLVPFLLCVFLAGPPSEPANEPTKLHAVPRLVCESRSLAAGSTGFIGITFRLDPHWHLYWNGQSDSGGPINYKLKMPEGFVAEPAQWPAPVRQVLPGDILNHIYEDEVTLIIPVRVPKTAGATKAEFSASLDWLVCEEACIAEQGEVSLSIPVASEGVAPESSPDAGLFKKARARHGAPLPAGRAEIAIEGLRARMKFEGASGLIFYPGPECSPIPALLSEGKSAGSALVLTLQPPEGQPPRLEGLLEVERPGETSAYYRVFKTP